MSIPEDVLASIKIPRDDLEKVLKLELATAIHRRGIISFGNTRKLAGVSKWEFLEELGKRKIERHYTEKGARSGLQ